MSRKILILFAHPALQRSRANRMLMRAAADLDGVTFHDLYETYPDLLIDVAAEQKLLLDHDVIVLQHPFYWYSAPAIVKEWEDLVLEHGFAYGHEGRALRGKAMMSAITTGGPETAYQAEGGNGFTIAELLRPFEMTARLCGLIWLPPFVVHGTHLHDAADFARAGEDYRRVLIALRDDVIEPGGEALAGLARINADLDRIGA